MSVVTVVSDRCHIQVACDSLGDPPNHTRLPRGLTPSGNSALFFRACSVRRYGGAEYGRGYDP